MFFIISISIEVPFSLEFNSQLVQPTFWEALSWSRLNTLYKRPSVFARGEPSHISLIHQTIHKKKKKKAQLSIAMKSLLLLTMLLVLCTGTSAGRDPNCALISSNLNPCTDVLRLGFLVGAPSFKCCHGLRIVRKIKIILGKETTCHCVRDCIAVHILGKNAPTLSSSETSEPSDNKTSNADLFIQLQKMCNVTLGFGIDENTTGN